MSFTSSSRLCLARAFLQTKTYRTDVTSASAFALLT